jgi:hypothetical protein
MPIGVVPKPHSDKLRLINDHSAGQYSCNSMIPKHEGSVKLDGMRTLGKALRRAHKSNYPNPLLLWKSDVSRAYRLIPMHPLWQLQQIVTIDGFRYVDRCNFFGGRAGCCLFCTFMALVLWIAQHVFGLSDLLAYVDDNFSWELAHHTIFYHPYHKFLPEKQGRLLLLWDQLRIPHEERKQEYGVKLKIIGYYVDAQSMQISMEPESQHDLLKAIHTFCHDRDPRRRTLREFQCMAGWINWGLNIQPRLHPGLATMYKKMS